MAVVYVNHGRWIVDCRCGGAEQVTRGQPAVVCQAIRRSIGGDRPCVTHIDIEWPDPAVAAAAVVALLDGRPTCNQNWQPHESLDELRDENRLNGVG